MHLFDKDRPEASPGVKALLGDGSAVPNPTIVLNDDGSCDIVVNLRNYEYRSNRSYSQFRLTIKLGDIEPILECYLYDPEDILLRCFGWKPQAISKSTTSIVRTQTNTESMSLRDLL